MKKTLYYADGTLRVIGARGFWFSGGGVKGSFGYYPHLKDDHNYPIYPDTQLRGDLRAATQWLEGGIEGKSHNPDDHLFPTRSEGGSMLFISDLHLSQASKDAWKTARFVTKPRIQVDDDNASVEENMLVLKERAWYNDDILESSVYVACSPNKEVVENNVERLSKAIDLMGGVGAERSRMLYAGRVGLTWEPVRKITVPDSPSSEPFEAIISLRSLANFRNRPMSGEKTLMLQCLPYITVEQLRGWFAKAYHLCYDEWPTVEQMKGITFTDCYPAPAEGGKISLAYPPSMNTTVAADGIVSDSTGHAQHRDQGTAEQLLSGKSSSLSRGSFVTDEQHPRVVRVPIERRMRNAMDENFKTKEAGLFVQESIPHGTLFAGRISCKGSDDKSREFNGKAKFILQNLRPWISRCLFDATLVTYDGSSSAIKAGRPALVVHSHYYVDVLNDKSSSNQLTVTTSRRYITHLHRPRRNRITIAPGSIINDEQAKTELASSLIGWSGFGNTFTHTVVEETPFVPEQFTPTDPWKDKKTLISPSQAGILRRFLAPATTDGQREAREEQLKLWLENVTQKNKEGKFSIDRKTLEQIQEALEEGGLGSAQAVIRHYLDRQALARWNRNTPAPESETPTDEKGGAS